MNTLGELKGAALVRSRGLALGFVGLALSAVFMVGVHLVGSGQINPIASTLSTLVFVDGYGWMFAASVLAMAMAAGGLVFALKGPRLLRFALWLVAFCCLLVAVFPTNRGGPLTVSAEIHRYAAGVAFFCVPIAALLVAARLDRTAAHRRWLMRSMVGTAVLLVVFLTSHFGVMPEAMQDMRGLFQRMMFVLQLVILAQLLHAATASGRAPRAVRTAAHLRLERTPLAA